MIAQAQTAANVAVVINENSPDSVKVGEHYARTRAVPPGQVLRIRTSTDENVSPAVYARSIELPLATAIEHQGLQDRILYLVLTRGVPVRIAGTRGADGTAASVDSELTLLYRRMTREHVQTIGRVENPYFLGARGLTGTSLFARRERDIFLVTRLDGSTLEEAMDLIDRSGLTVPNQTTVASLFRVAVPGKIGLPSIQELVLDGAAGAAGYVDDPLVQGTIRSDIVSAACLAGYNLAEAYYLANPYLSWQAVVIGDPLLAAPWRTGDAALQMESPFDDLMLAPALFANRRLASMAKLYPDADPRAIASALRAEALELREDQRGAKTALEQAIHIDPEVAFIQLQLGVFLDRRGDHEGAMRAYRRVLELQPRHTRHEGAQQLGTVRTTTVREIALNNLAYTLAVQQRDPKTALPLALEAVALAPTDPLRLDTLAWVQYRLGDHNAASQLIELAARGAPDNPTVRLHAAIIQFGAGQELASTRHLIAALALKPDVARIAEVRRMITRLQVETVTGPRPDDAVGSHVNEEEGSLATGVFSLPSAP